MTDKDNFFHQRCSKRQRHFHNCKGLSQIRNKFITPLQWFRQIPATLDWVRRKLRRSARNSLSNAYIKIRSIG